MKLFNKRVKKQNTETERVRKMKIEIVESKRTRATELVKKRENEREIKAYE
jgi:hypothetical protein